MLSRAVVAPVRVVHEAIFGALGNQPFRPNRPVLPFQSLATSASFIDPSVIIAEGPRIAFGAKDYVAPFATLDAKAGLIEVGSGSIIGDNASLVANPSRGPGGPALVVGDNVAIDPGATILGPSVIGASHGAPTRIGTGARVEGAIIAPGASVGALAWVGPGVVVPGGMMVLPGAVVITEAQAIDPAYGKVVKITGPSATTVSLLAQAAILSAGYTTLYQGNVATGPSPVSAPQGVFNGSVAPVKGVSEAPPFPGQSARQGPNFPSPNGKVLEGLSPRSPTRVIGQVNFSAFPREVSQALSYHVSIRSDEGAPVTLGAIGKIGRFVTITPRGGTATAPGRSITIGDGIVIGDGAVITASTTNLTIGGGVTVGGGSVIDGGAIGGGARIGAGAYLQNTIVAPAATIPPGAILINQTVAR